MRRSVNVRLIAVRAVLVSATVAIALVAAELATRLVDGYTLTSMELVRARPVTEQADRDGKWLAPNDSREYASRTPLAPGIDARWFDLAPEVLPPEPVDPELNERYLAAIGHALPAVYEWNRQFITAVLCQGDTSTHPYLAHQLESLSDVYVFDPVDGTPFPTFRFLRHAHYPSGLRTNAFGWRGADIPIDKPPGRIRIAFVGASTTVAPHADPFSYPEYIGRWLNEWAKTLGRPVSFDVVNAGREGILSASIEAVVRNELRPVRPDIVVYYEGVNQFWPSDFMNRPAVRALQALQGGTSLDRSSAMVSRVHQWIERPSTGKEPPKPSLSIRWPADLDEHDPPLGDPRLPVQLPRILHDLDRMRDDLQAIDATLMPSSFVALVDPGLVLSPRRDAFIFRELNERYWPFTYAHLRRYFDFENRAFRKYARTQALPFNDLAAEYPRDPRLFVDMVHMTPAGVKLQAWIVFQYLVTELERRLQNGTLPLADPGGRVSHPAFTGPARRVESIAALERRCR